MDSKSVMDLVSEVELLSLPGGITVAQDHRISYGGKARGYKFFQNLKSSGVRGVVLVATGHGMGQVATAWACREFGLTCDLFITGTSQETSLTRKAANLGAKIHRGLKEYNRISEMEVLARKFAQDTGLHYLEFGLRDSGFITALSENLREMRNKYSLTPSEIWVVGGTGVFASALGIAFPGVLINIVQPGVEVWKDLLQGLNYKIHVYPKELGGFEKPVAYSVPYESLGNYDAKVWYFNKRMKPGALIWNIH